MKASESKSSCRLFFYASTLKKKDEAWEDKGEREREKEREREREEGRKLMVL